MIFSVKNSTHPTESVLFRTNTFIFLGCFSNFVLKVGILHTRSVDVQNALLLLCCNDNPCLGGGGEHDYFFKQLEKFRSLG